MPDNLLIRIAEPEALDAVLAVERAAFGSDEEAELVRNLLTDITAAPLLSLLALVEDQPVGHILFTGVTLEGCNRPVPASLLAPLAVIPEYQRQGVGGRLIQEGLHLLRDEGIELVFVLGHPEYYPRHGFITAGTLGLQAPYPIAPKNIDAWMVQALQSGILGTVTGTVRCATSLDKPGYWVE